MNGHCLRIVGCLTVATVLFASSVTRADDPIDPAAKIKQLNEMTGEEAFGKAIGALAKNDKESKAIVEAAVKIAAAKPADLTYNTARGLGILAVAKKDNASATALFKLAVNKGLEIQSATKAYTAYVNLLEVLMGDKKYDEAIKEINKFLDKELGKTNEEFGWAEIIIQEYLVRATAGSGKIDEAVKMADKLAEEFPRFPQFHRLKADVLHEAEKFEEAEAAYLETLKMLENKKTGPDDEDSDNTKGQIRVTRYLLSGVYIDLNKVDKAAEQLQILLKETPDNPTFNNDLGYIWADHNMNLDESEKLIRKALDLQKKINEKRKEFGEEPLDSGAYLDSLGWVLFKKTKYPEAKKELLEAVKTKEGQHVEILDHLAEVHMVLGEKADAIKVWEQALKVDTESKRDKKRKVEIEEKIKKLKEKK